MTENLLPLSDRPLRIVFEHKSGPWAGLREIVGRSDELPEGVLPAAEGPFSARPDNRLAVAGLVKVERGYALYKEINTDMKTFDPRQQ